MAHGEYRVGSYLRVGRMTGGITRDDWLKAMEDAGLVQETDQEALTVSEFAEMFELPDSTARARLDRLVEAGRAKETRKQVEDSQRRRTIVAAYRLVADGA